MQRSRVELEQMDHEELVTRVLDMQDMVKESLLVRAAMQKLINRLLTLKDDEVSHYASLPSEHLSPEERMLKEVWAEARHALANPSGLVKR
ncbi:MAG: hypothetical protein R2880_10790 [Deinococcales bacterium]